MTALLADIAVTSSLIEICRGIGRGDLSERARAVAAQCLLDWFGVTLAGSREPLACILRAEADEQGGNSHATIVGTGMKVPARTAALVNGATSHALDYDDVHLAMSGHPTVPVLPALLALAEHRGAALGDVVTAFAAGVEMECRIGAYVMPGHYRAGFHATGTLGTFGAAAACAHLLGLSEEQWGHAMGIAGSQASGLKSMFGTMTKPLQAGNAAANGLLAAQLAERGFTANPEVLETAQGFAATQHGNGSQLRATRSNGGLAVEDVLFKYHAACYGTHETIEGMLRLKEREQLSADDVASIRLDVPRGHLAMCNIQEPTTALEGKFSLRFTAALALAHGDTSEAAFTAERVRDAALVELRDRVRVEPWAEERQGTRVTVSLRDGRELSEAVNLDVPDPDLARQGTRLEAKFRSLAAPVLGAGRAETLLRTVLALDEATEIRELMRLAATEAGDA